MKSSRQQAATQRKTDPIPQPALVNQEVAKFAHSARLSSREGPSTSRDSLNDNLAAAWLQHFYRETGLPRVEADELGTTFLLTGAVLLASVIIAEHSELRTARITGLPEEFASVVIWLMAADQLWSSAEVLDLESTLRTEAGNLASVLESLECALEKFWNDSTVPHMDLWLGAARGGQTLKVS